MSFIEKLFIGIFLMLLWFMLCASIVRLADPDPAQVSSAAKKEG